MMTDESAAYEPDVDPAVLAKWQALKKQVGAEMANRVSGVMGKDGVVARTLVDDEIGVVRIELSRENQPGGRRLLYRSSIWSDSDGTDMFSDWDPRDPLHHPHPDPVDVVFPPEA
jgi:hypothetical protein